MANRSEECNKGLIGYPLPKTALFVLWWRINRPDRYNRNDSARGWSSATIPAIEFPGPARYELRILSDRA